MSRQRTGHGNGPSALALAAGVAAVGLITGLVATAGRRFALHAAETLTGDWDDALKAEHLMILEIFDLIDQTGVGDVGKRRRLLTRLRAALDKHAFEEENVIYPAARLAGDTELSARLFADHAEVKVLLFELEHADPAEAGWCDIVKRLRRALEAHFREEEDDLFPSLIGAMPSERRAALTTELHRSGVDFA